MNNAEIKLEKFTFYRNYYEIIKYLDDENQLIIYKAIMEYMFEDNEPNLNGITKGIWCNISMPLNTSKNNANNGSKGGKIKIKSKRNSSGTKAKSKAKSKRNLSEKESERSSENEANNNISYFLFLISNNNNINTYLEDKRLLREKIEEWFKYKDERKEIYQETSIKTLTNRIIARAQEYGYKSVIEIIDLSISSNWQGIVWDKLEKLKENKNEKENETIIRGRIYE